MNSLLSAKLIWGLLSMGSLVSIVGTIIKDNDINSTSFMSDSEVQVHRSFDDYNSERVVASLNKGESFTIPRIVLNNDNMKSIDGMWEITRITNDSDIVVYDTYRPEDRKTIIELPISLVATSEVRIDKDEDLRFYILFLHESKKTISLIRPFGKGYEIVEAKRSKVANKINSYAVTADKKSVSKFTNSVGNLKKVENNKDEIHNLELDKVIYPSKTKEILTGDNVSGRVSVNHQVMDDFEVSLTFKNLKGEEEIIEISESSINIKAGGMFKFEHDNTIVNGIITKNGKAGFRMRFITGSLQGASINFVTEKEAQRIRDLKDDMPYDYENIGKSRSNNNLAVEPVDEDTQNIQTQEQEEASIDRKISQIEITGGEYTQRDYHEEYQEEDESSKELLDDETAGAKIEKSGFEF